MIATPKEQPHAFKSYDTYTSVFDNNQIAVHIGKPIMVPFDTFKSHSRTNGGNMMLFLNTIISVKPPVFDSDESVPGEEKNRQGDMANAAAVVDPTASPSVSAAAPGTGGVAEGNIDAHKSRKSSAARCV